MSHLRPEDDENLPLEERVCRLAVSVRNLASSTRNLLIFIVVLAFFQLGAVGLAVWLDQEGQQRDAAARDRSASQQAAFDRERAVNRARLNQLLQSGCRNDESFKMRFREQARTDLREAQGTLRAYTNPRTPQERRTRQRIIDLFGKELLDKAIKDQRKRIDQLEVRIRKFAARPDPDGPKGPRDGCSDVRLPSKTVP